ncbi:helix-turn-helix domain-containing protein [Marinisporobacter balticus]|uniref:XRE family transcriptional regulator n=1 Tax=Marinisporobacter balticus TaxID=2018667 RepID=A0A4R2KM99_9FIRM|nr:XRE family transcriptional regulator [Marinisporobacter balticus]TCO74823.1 XRE family transcriptional regulator [Marinisporobacter balticus]
MAADIGKKIKELRTNKNLTLKDLSEKTNLSIGYLSQLERGLTTIAIDSLENIAKVLDTDIACFFREHKNSKKAVLRNHEKEVFEIINSQFIYYHLTNDVESKNLLPRLIEILPSMMEEKIITYQHEGEEFIYVLEGILTMIIDNEQYALYPGDSAHIDSNRVHNWANYTNKKVKLLTVHTPNFLKKA